MVSKERKEDILEKIRKAGSEEYVTEWDKEGKIGVQKKKSNMKKGKRAKGAGARFELQVREDLKEKNWIVDKWTNNVDLENQEVVQAKRKFNPFKKVMTIGTGFPDFIAFQLVGENKYNIIGVECKMNGILSKEEKQKCAVLLKNKIFSQILIAKKIKQGRFIKVGYVDFKEKFGDKFL